MALWCRDQPADWLSLRHVYPLNCLKKLVVSHSKQHLYFAFASEEAARAQDASETDLDSTAERPEEAEPFDSFSIVQVLVGDLEKCTKFLAAFTRMSLLIPIYIRFSLKVTRFIFPEKFVFILSV